MSRAAAKVVVVKGVERTISWTNTYAKEIVERAKTTFKAKVQVKAKESAKIIEKAGANAESKTQEKKQTVKGAAEFGLYFLVESVRSFDLP